MNRQTVFSIVLAFFVSLTSCGGAQQAEVKLETRPLEENRAFEIIEEVFAERGYRVQKDVSVSMSGQRTFKADYRIDGKKMAVEYLTEQDRIALGTIPQPAAGSRLHVISVRVLPTPGNERQEPVYIIFIDDRNFVYHVNPTSEQRADVTFLEIDSRLRRDLADYISWYESSIATR